jgi:hypothetical protein
MRVDWDNNVEIADLILVPLDWPLCEAGMGGGESWPLLFFLYMYVWIVVDAIRLTVDIVCICMWRSRGHWDVSLDPCIHIALCSCPRSRRRPL